MMIDPVQTHGAARAGLLALLDLDSGRRLTWAAFDKAANRAAHFLIAHLGPASAARVATLTRNCIDMVVVQMGCVRAGAIFVPVNWRLAPPEIAAIIKDAEPAILFHDEDFDIDDHDGRRFLLTDLSGLTDGLPDHPPPAAARQKWEAPSTLLYTSGTSGTPKGVMISEANAYWGSTNFMLGNGLSSASRFLCDLPLFHTAGLFAVTRTAILAGGVAIISGGFDAANTIRAFADDALGITHYFSVPQMAQMLWNHPDFDPHAFSRLQVYATGGGPNPPAQIERFVRAGIPMSDGFGMTETGSNSGMPVDDKERLVAKAGSCGLPYIALQTRIVDEDDCDVADGETGELIVRGPSVTKGYWRQPERTADAFLDGWFRTGDAVRKDADGFLYIVDRKKDMFISGGENVYPAEVEAAIAELESVTECAVIGVSDDKWGEVGWAYIIAPAGEADLADTVLAHCQARLAGFKVPKRVIVTDVIPRTATGKIKKHELKAVADTSNAATQ